MKLIAFYLVLFILFVFLSISCDAKRRKKKTPESKKSEEVTDEIKYGTQEELNQKIDELKKKKLVDDDDELTEEELAEKMAKLGREEGVLMKELIRTRKNYGAESREMAVILHKVGKNVYHQGRFDEATDFAKEVVQIHEKIDGPEHINTAMALCNLGSVSFRTGKKKICELAMYRATDILIKKYGKESPEVLLHRGKMLTFRVPFGDQHEGISYDEYLEEMQDAEEELADARDDAEDTDEF